MDFPLFRPRLFARGTIPSLRRRRCCARGRTVLCRAACAGRGEARCIVRQTKTRFFRALDVRRSMFDVQPAASAVAVRANGMFPEMCGRCAGPNIEHRTSNIEGLRCASQGSERESRSFSVFIRELGWIDAMSIIHRKMPVQSGCSGTSLGSAHQ